jgi:hypothetical protein
MPMYFLVHYSNQYKFKFLVEGYWEAGLVQKRNGSEILILKLLQRQIYPAEFAESGTRQDCFLTLRNLTPVFCVHVPDFLFGMALLGYELEAYKKYTAALCLI